MDKKSLQSIRAQRDAYLLQRAQTLTKSVVPDHIDLSSVNVKCSFSQSEHILFQGRSVLLRVRSVMDDEDGVHIVQRASKRQANRRPQQQM